MTATAEMTSAMDAQGFRGPFATNLTATKLPEDRKILSLGDDDDTLRFWYSAVPS